MNILLPFRSVESASNITIVASFLLVWPLLFSLLRPLRLFLIEFFSEGTSSTFTLNALFVWAYHTWLGRCALERTHIYYSIYMRHSQAAANYLQSNIIVRMHSVCMCSVWFYSTNMRMHCGRIDQFCVCLHWAQVMDFCFYYIFFLLTLFQSHTHAHKRRLRESREQPAGFLLDDEVISMQNTCTLHNSTLW